VTAMPDELTIGLLMTIIALIIDLERRVARLETLINNIKNNRRREEA